MELSTAVAYGGIKKAIETVKGLTGAITETKLAEVKLPLLSLLIEAREAELENEKRIGALEAEIVRLNDWSAEAQNYELADTGQGALAYRRNDAVHSTEPAHWLCPNCFAKREKSFLIPETLAVGRTNVLRCHPCGLEIVTRGVRQPSQGRS